MPANLNALIRYKTINSCLYGGKRKWSVGELMEACSEALGESRGRYKTISERTVRDDLRVMKSDILGFNAPISQEKGLYFYSDPRFSILTLKITDDELAERILAILMGLRKEIQHPELESLIALLGDLTRKTPEQPDLHEDMQPHDTDTIHLIVRMESEYEDSVFRRMKKSPSAFSAIPGSDQSGLSWKDIYLAIQGLRKKIT